jgi:hypothetical protein
LVPPLRALLNLLPSESIYSVDNVYLRFQLYNLIFKPFHGRTRHEWINKYLRPLILKSSRKSRVRFVLMTRWVSLIDVKYLSLIK